MKLPGALLLILLLSPVSVALAQPSTAPASEWTDQQQQRAKQRLQQAQQELQRQQELLRAARLRAGSDQGAVRALQQRREELAARVQRQTERLQQQQAEVQDTYVSARQAIGDLRARLLSFTTGPVREDLPGQLQELAASARPLSLHELSLLWEWLHESLTYTATRSWSTQRVQSTPTTLEAQPVMRLGSVVAVSQRQLLRLDAAGMLRPTSAPEIVSAGNTWMIPFFYSTTPAALQPTRIVSDAGVVGLLIVLLGACGVLLLLYRVINVLATRRAQLRKLDNSPAAHLEATQALHRRERLESIAGWINAELSRELLRLARGQLTLNFIIVAAPLLGLLGTVTGMIVLFDQINLYGGGDPVLMSAGVARALTTTLLGLAVSIPLLLGQRWVSGIAARLVLDLDCNATALLARSCEARQ